MVKEASRVPGRECQERTCLGLGGVKVLPGEVTLNRPEEWIKGVILKGQGS